MTTWRTDMSLAVGAVIFATLLAVRLRASAPDASAAEQVIPVVSRSADTPDPSMLDAAQQRVVARDPFRLSRKPSTTPYARSLPAQSSLPIAPRVSLVLKGIVGGPPWQAVLDGIPGQPPGTVVSAGATFDKLRIRSVSRDTVVIQSPDTTWRLSLTRGGGTP